MEITDFDRHGELNPPLDGPEFEYDLEDCGMMPLGQCLKAGSEECDWDCPRGGMNLR